VGGVPPNVDLEQVRTYLTSLPGVQNVHDLHVWGLSTREVALTAHLVKPEPDHNDHLTEEAMEALHERFDIDHVTLQWEREKLSICS
jgi:cobalt-zinc-cadmium efflux system protein